MLQAVVDNRVMHTANSANAIRGLHLVRTNQLVSRLHRDYVREVVKQKNQKPTPLAKAIRVAPSTLTRILKQPDDSSVTLSAGVLAKLQAFSGIPPPQLDLASPTPRVSGVREDAVPYQYEGSEFDTAIKLLVGKRRNADPWTIKTRALECAGYLPGDVVIVDLGAQAMAGEPVCAQVYDWRKGTAETVMRIFEPPYLVAATYDSSLRKPLLVDDDRVTIKGLILPYRLRHPATQ